MFKGASSERGHDTGRPLLWEGITEPRRIEQLSTRTKGLLACAFMLCFLMPLLMYAKGVKASVGVTFAIIALFGIVTYAASRSKPTSTVDVTSKDDDD